MEFGEKIRYLRKERNLNQAELAQKIGISLRAVASWESDGRRPRDRSVYYRLAEVFQCDSNYLLMDDYDPNLESDSYDVQGMIQPRAILDQAKAYFAGGKLSEEDMLQFMTDIQQIYLDSKREAAKRNKKPTSEM